ncbi:hypothetical protein ACFLV6_00190 [Chloroflexota bacterium]
MIRVRVRERIALLSLSHLLEKIGIQITPYYITQEFLSDEMELSLEPKIKPVLSGFLSISEIEKMYSHPEIKSLAREIGNWRDDNCLCFALRHNEEIVAYMWCNLSRGNINFSPFILNDDEAYLFRARTLSAYRGKNLTPFLRYLLYKSLIDMKRTKFYSITEYLNTPARNFKKKLNAKHIKLCLYFGLFNKRLWNVTLKKYQVADQ